MTMTMFRRFGMVAAGVVFAGLALCAVPMRAQDTAPAPPGPPPGGRGAGMQQHQLDMLTKVLALTPDQVTQVKAIDEDTMKQAQAVRADTSLSQADRRTKMMDLRNSSQGKIRALLTPDQQTKYDVLQAEMKAREQERMQNRQGGAPTTPPAPPQ